MRRRIVVLGATGRTGRLIAAELAGRDDVVLVARDPLPLERVAAETDLTARRASLHDLGGVLIPGDVLLSCVGPYDQLGDAVVRTAITGGATYLDVSGEPAFLRRVVGPLAAQARTAGTTLLPAVGYEYLPGLLLSELALQAVDGAVERLEVAYFADGGLQAGSASGRRSLVRALGRATTTWRGAAHRQEPVGARRGRFEAGGRTRSTVSLGGAEVWWLPARHRQLRSVDVHTGWFGPLGPAVTLLARLAEPARALAVDRLLDRAAGLLGDGPEAGLEQGTSRFVARAVDGRGEIVVRREGVGGNAIVLAARLAATTADAVAGISPADLPPGATDPATVLGVAALQRSAEWAGLIVL